MYHSPREYFQFIRNDIVSHTYTRTQMIRRTTKIVQQNLFFFCYYFNWCFWFACWAQRNITYTESFENGVNSELQLGIGNKESTKTNGVHNIMHNSHNICDVHISNVSKFSFFAFKYLLTEPTTCRLIFI